LIRVFGISSNAIAKDVLEDYLLKEKVDLKSLINEKKRKWNH